MGRERKGGGKGRHGKEEGKKKERGGKIWDEWLEEGEEKEKQKVRADDAMRDRNSDLERLGTQTQR